MAEDFIRVAVIERIGRRHSAQLKRKRVFSVALLLTLLLIMTAFFVQSQMHLFMLVTGSTSNENGGINPSDFNTGEQDDNETPKYGINGFFSLPQFPTGFATYYMCSSDALSIEKHFFMPTDSVYATVSEGSQPVKLHVTIHQEVWNEGDALTDVSGGTETLDLSPDHPSTIEIWKPTLVPGCYDVVLDLNGDGVFNVETDLTCKLVVGIQNVIPEVPLGVAMISMSMFAAVAVFASLKRFQVE